MSHYFYLARCSDDSLYAGTCLDLKDREKTHNEGKGAKYTRSRKPVRMIYSESFKTLGEARRREAEVKKWRKSEKEGLVSPKRPKNVGRRRLVHPKKSKKTMA
ncbi:MAG: GIY-YIG nuclease family protein [Candidatus Peribacteraceae bacterium]